MLDMSIGAMVPGFCILQGSMWVWCVRRQGFCGRDEWNKTQEGCKRLQGKAKIVATWVGFTRIDSRMGHKRLGFKHSEDHW